MKKQNKTVFHLSRSASVNVTGFDKTHTLTHTKTQQTQPEQKPLIAVLHQL